MILLVAVNSKFGHTNIALRSIKNYVNSKVNMNIYLKEFTINQKIEDIIREIFELKPSLVAFSVYIWNVEYIFKIILELKKVLSETKILLGGPEVSYNALDIMNLYESVDYIIVGEGEESFYEFLTKNISEVSSLYYRTNEGIKFNNFQKIINTPIFPYENELMNLNNRILYYESSRGCPFQCSYCLSSKQNLRFFPIEIVKKDLSKFIENKVKIVKFVDRTFNIDKKRTYEIWKFLLDNFNGITKFHFEIKADLLDEELIKFLDIVPKNCFQFEIGIQTINKNSLNAIKRNNDLDLIKSNIKKINKNIHIHLDLIAGLPYDSFETFRESFDYVFSLSPNYIQLGFLKILKGTDMFKNSEKFGYKYFNFSPYEVISNNFIKYEEILKLKRVEKILDIYYNSGNFKTSLNFIISKYKSPFDFFINFSDYLHKLYYFDISHKIIENFNNLYEFFLNNFSEIELFEECLKFDYLNIEKPGFFPYWFKPNTDKTMYEKALENNQFGTFKEMYKKSHFEIFNYAINDNFKVKKTPILFKYHNNFETEVIFL